MSTSTSAFTETETNDLGVADMELESSVDLESVIEVDDPDADFNIPSSPPPAGDYNLEWSLQTRPDTNDGQNGACFVKLDKNRNPFIQLHLQGKIVDENSPFNGYIVRNSINSIKFPSKPTSEVHFFMSALGEPLPKQAKSKELTAHIINVLVQKPIGKAHLEWKASYNIGGREWKDQHLRMNQFPTTTKDSEGNEIDLPEGEYNYITEREDNGEPLYAQAYVHHHLKS